MIREAITSFVTRRDYSISMGSSHLPKKAREEYRRVTAFLSRSDLSLLGCISKETGRYRTELLRKAVEGYLSKLV
jgi:hypothetical protein